MNETTSETTTETTETTETLDELAVAARRAARALAATSTDVKDAALAAMAEALEAHAPEIVEANALDVAAARRDGATDAVIDRLTLTEERVRAVAEAVRTVIELDDPVGDLLSESTLANGLRLQKVRVPLGVVGVIYEGRPNVTVDAAALAVKAGNAVLLRGSSIARHSNVALVRTISEAASNAGLPEGTIQFVPPTRELAQAMMRARGQIDLLIPRGGNDLIQTIVRESIVPVIETGVGNCHVYVDASADLAKALAILVNAKVQRPGVCNAAESFLVHRDVADEFVPKALAALAENGVEVRGDPAIAAYSDGVVAATDEDHRTEFLDLVISAKVVGSVDEAVDHINA
ncbi:MAG: glutamate-5-semialdehyde dehydrogenase, partial [Actinomycetota bacterium]